jgi:hypothetical protein
MKNDPIFKFVAAIVIAGVLIAIAAPNHPATATATVVAKSLAAKEVDGAQ